VWNLLTIGGLLLILVSSFADQIGVGQHPGFGLRQGAGVVLGLVLILVSPYMKRLTKIMQEQEERIAELEARLDARQ
jgi:hypothetical protein